MPRYAISSADLRYVRQTNLINMLKQHYPLVINWVQDLPFKEGRKEDEGERDLAGKLPFAMKMMSLGLDNHCIVDPSNSGGVLKYGKASPDALFIEKESDITKYLRTGRGKLIEIKGAIKSAKGNTYDFKWRENGFKNEEITTVVFILRDENPPKNSLRTSWLEMGMEHVNQMFVAMIPMKRLHDIIRRYKKCPGPWRFSLPKECSPNDKTGQLSKSICDACTFKGRFNDLTIARLQSSPLNLLPQRIEQVFTQFRSTIPFVTSTQEVHPKHWWRKRERRRRNHVADVKRHLVQKEIS